jgi:hypothetical protein
VGTGGGHPERMLPERWGGGVGRRPTGFSRAWFPRAELRAETRAVHRAGGLMRGPRPPRASPLYLTFPSSIIPTFQTL